eukprot:gene7975-1190_t
MLLLSRNKNGGLRPVHGELEILLLSPKPLLMSLSKTLSEQSRVWSHPALKGASQTKTVKNEGEKVKEVTTSFSLRASTSAKINTFLEKALEEWNKELASKVDHARYLYVPTMTMADTASAAGEDGKGSAPHALYTRYKAGTKTESGDIGQASSATSKGGSEGEITIGKGASAGSAGPFATSTTEAGGPSTAWSLKDFLAQEDALNFSDLLNCLNEVVDT